MDSEDKNNKNKSDSTHLNLNPKTILPLAERRGQKILKFKLPITKEKEDTTIEYVKAPF